MMDIGKGRFSEEMILGAVEERFPQLLIHPGSLKVPACQVAMQP
jgi:hypothetical protein